MRALAPVLCGALLASCTTAQAPATRSAEAQRDLDQLIAGKAAGAPLRCVPAVNTNDLRIIDGRTLGYAAGSKTVYIVHLSQGCASLAGGNYTLVTEHFGGDGPCTGDAARVVDLTSRIPQGSCIVGEIVPYSRPG
jgi:hypothetical protein